MAQTLAAARAVSPLIRIRGRTIGTVVNALLHQTQLLQPQLIKVTVCVILETLLNINAALNVPLALSRPRSAMQ